MMIFFPNVENQVFSTKFTNVSGSDPGLSVLFYLYVLLYLYWFHTILIVVLI